MTGVEDESGSKLITVVVVVVVIVRPPGILAELHDSLPHTGRNNDDDHNSDNKESTRRNDSWCIHCHDYI